ncbi:hypothetical protein LguiB_023076 [Lonicera macranthoides]
MSLLIRYGDGSYTSGQLGCDCLVFGATSLNKFVFWCGWNNKGLFGGASGLMGLGRSNLSLVSQTYDMFGGSFSYCLPSTETDSLGSLILGGDSSIYNNSTPISYTKMVQNPQLPTFYFLNLTGITIGGVELQATVDIPTIRMQFEGNTELIVDLTRIFYFIKTDASQVWKKESLRISKPGMQHNEEGLPLEFLNFGVSNIH